MLNDVSKVFPSFWVNNIAKFSPWSWWSRHPTTGFWPL